MDIEVQRFPSNEMEWLRGNDKSLGNVSYSSTVERMKMCLTSSVWGLARRHDAPPHVNIDVKHYKRREIPNTERSASSASSIYHLMIFLMETPQLLHSKPWHMSFYTSNIVV